MVYVINHHQDVFDTLSGKLNQAPLWIERAEYELVKVAYQQIETYPEPFSLLEAITVLKGNLRQ